MTDAFQLVLPGFEGTANELLEDVRRRRVAPETLELAAVTSQILDRLDAVTADLDQTGELAAQVSRLILLKASALLAEPPDIEEDDEIRSVRERSPHWAGPAAFLAGRQGLESFPTAEVVVGLETQREPLSLHLLVETMRDLAARGEPKTTVRAPSFVSLELTVSRLLRRLGRGTVRLAELLRGADRMTAVTHFLAVLELVRGSRAAASQGEVFGDIAIEGTAVDGARAAAV